MPVDIAFITVNYNTLHFVKGLSRFFSALKAPFTFSFTVVDNGSHDGSPEFLRSCSGVNYLQAGGNLGYGSAINLGVAATDSKYICAMNTDVVLNDDALFRLWRFLEERDEVGVCAPRITFKGGRDQGMVFKPYLFSHYANWFAKIVARYWKLKIAKASSPVRVDGVMGAFFLIRRSAILRSRLFDEDFFFFYEDTALAHSLKNRGVPCFVIPDAVIVHLGGGSGSGDSVSCFYKNKYLYLEKFYGRRHAKNVYFVDRTRILRKWLLYSLLSFASGSRRVKAKRQHYWKAWSGARLES